MNIANPLTFIRAITLFILVHCFVNNLYAQISQVVILREGVVLDKGRGEIYLLAPDQRLEVLSSKTGKLLWETAESFNPLGLVKGRLVGQVKDASKEEAFVLKTIDPKRKGTTLKADSINLPDNIKVDFAEATNAFMTQSKIIGGDIYVLWEYYPPLQGIYKGEKPQHAGLDSMQAGIIKIDKNTGKANLVPGDELLSNFQKSILLEGEHKLPNISAEQFLSADDKHILVSIPLEIDTAFMAYLWQIYDKNGKKVGELYDYRSFAPFYVMGNTMIYEWGPYIRRMENQLVEVPLQIKAYDLTNGKTLWARTILDESNRKYSPPARSVK